MARPGADRSQALPVPFSSLQCLSCRIPLRMGTMAAVCLAGALICAGTRAARGEEDPVFEGKKLSEWVVQLRTTKGWGVLFAAMALGDMGPQARAALPALYEKVKTEKPPMRWAILEAIGRIGPDEAGVEVLLVHFEKGEDRWYAICALGKAGANSKKALPKLREALNDKSPSIRFAVARAVWGITGDTSMVEPVIGVLKEALRETDKEGWEALVKEAAEFLSEIGPAADSGLPVLKELRDSMVFRDLRKELDKAIERIGQAAKAGPEGKQGKP
jgi:hypothetical protein